MIAGIVVLFFYILVLAVVEIGLVWLLAHKLKFIGLAKLFMPDNETPEVHWSIIGTHWDIFKTPEGALFLAVGLVSGLLFFLLLGVPAIRRHKQRTTSKAQLAIETAEHNAASKAMQQIAQVQAQAQHVMANARKIERDAQAQVQQAQQVLAQAKKMKQQAQQVQQTANNQVQQMQGKVDAAELRCRNAAGAAHRRTQKKQKKPILTALK